MFDGGSTALEPVHHALLSGTDRVGEAEEEQRDRQRCDEESDKSPRCASRRECRSGQTGQDGPCSPKACKRISEPEDGKAQYGSPAALAGLKAGERPA